MNYEPRAEVVKRDGIAIIVVLGLLSLMMIMAVAFSTSMRIERAGAGSYSRSVFIRHVEASALSRAMADIDAKMATQTNAPLYPDWDNEILVSGTGAVSKVKIAWGDALDYVPDSITGQVAAAQAGWVEIEDKVNQGNLVGCFAYVAVNCSGLLDANKVGGFDRSAGTNAYELRLGGLPDFGSESKFAAFTNTRAKHGLYADMREFRTFNAGLSANLPVSSFSTFSLSPESKYARSDGTLHDKVFIGGSLADLVNKKNGILVGLQDCGFDIARANTIYDNMLDYVDPDSTPRNFESGCTEQVPMINEIQVKVAGGFMPSNQVFRCKYDVNLECSYPFDFDATKPLTFDISYEVKLEPFGGNTVTGLVPSSNLTANSSWSIAAGHQFKQVPLSFSIDVPTNVMADPSKAAIQIRANVRASVKLNGNPVDLAPSPQGANVTTWLRIQQTNALPLPLSGVRMEDSMWTECVDARFNWRASIWGGIQWVSGDRQRTLGLANPRPSIGAANVLTEYFASASNTVAFDGNFSGGIADDSADSRVADRPLLTPGELGSLAFAPLQTVRLYDHGKKGGAAEPAYHRVLDVFTCRANEVRRGMVNINSTDENVLAAVFNMTPRKEYMANPEAIDWATAADIAEEIVVKQPYASVSEIGRITNWPTFCQSSSEPVTEALIRNSSGLLTTRQNLFVVFIAAGASYKGAGSTGQKSLSAMLSHRRAVALLWRDPYPDANQNHGWLVKYFSMIDE